MSQKHKGTVLVVDDEPANLGVLFECLQQAHFRVLVAEDGAGALECAKRSPPDIVLLMERSCTPRPPPPPGPAGGVQPWTERSERLRQISEGTPLT